MNDIDALYRSLFTARPSHPSILRVPALRYLMADGEGDPSGQDDFQKKVEAMYAIAYTVRFTLKAEKKITYKVAPLEGLWWVEGDGNLLDHPKSEWKWRLLLLQPAPVTAPAVERARRAVQQKKKDNPAIAGIQFASFTEGWAAQVMHVGPYSTERPTIESLHAFIAAQGKVPRGKHHEIYLGDPRKAKPEKLKTILRQPIASTRP